MAATTDAPPSTPNLTIASIRGVNSAARWILHHAKTHAPPGSALDRQLVVCPNQDRIAWTTTTGASCSSTS
jgi:hypothetical protein